MDKKQIYDDIFKHVFHIETSRLDESFTFQAVENWDSLSHMTLITELEDAFDILLGTDDILHFGSYTNGMKILQKYGVDFER